MPTPEEQERLVRELAEELQKIRIEDLLLQMLMTVSSIGYRRLGLTADARQDRDLEQTRLAIETMRALVPVLERFVPAELVRDFNQSVANLQLAYAKAASEEATDAAGVRPREESRTNDRETVTRERTSDEAAHEEAESASGSTTTPGEHPPGGLTPEDESRTSGGDAAGVPAAEEAPRDREDADG